MAVTSLPLPPTPDETPETVYSSGAVDTSVLAEAAALRFPNLTELEGGERVEALIDHITATAIMRARVEELRLSAHVQLLELEQQWRAIDAPTNRTKEQVEAYRRQRRPDLAGQVETARWVIARCTEQINRLGGTDYDAASRAYTLLGG